mgnify:CR=1 FL=1
MSKQTSVEWLVEQLPIRIINSFQQEIEKAKSMDKQQTIEFGKKCVDNIELSEQGELLMVKSPEEIYIEVYGGNVDLGEMINVWIEHHGYLDLDTDEQEIIDFYNETYGGNK